MRGTNNSWERVASVDFAPYGSIQATTAFGKRFYVYFTTCMSLNLASISSHRESHPPCAG
jgi:hypothetical protein